MGYDVVSYLVDLNHLRHIYGSNDTSIIQGIEQRFADDVAYWNAQIEEDWPIGTPTINQVLRANIAGKFPWLDTVVPYKLALELFCKYVGTPLPNDLFVGLRPSGVQWVEEVEPSMADLVFHSSSPVAIPGMEDEKMYRVGHMTYKMAGERLETYQLAAITELEPDSTWEEQAAAQFYGWLQSAVQARKSIVSFFY